MNMQCGCPIYLTPICSSISFAGIQITNMGTKRKRKQQQTKPETGKTNKICQQETNPSTEDRFTNLPDSLRHHILSKLLSKQAV